jgi:SAM-dependent methyltransferase
VGARDIEPRRLNFGCGPMLAAGWLNSDRLAAPGNDLPCDIRTGLPLADASMDYVVAMHVLQDLAYPEIEPALRELRRVLAPGGVLRIGVPDLDRAIAAYQRGDPAYFYVPDTDAGRLGSKLVTQVIWYGSVRTPFTFDFAAETMGRAGFGAVVRCEFGATASRFADIVTLDNRERETLFVEATP